MTITLFIVEKDFCGTTAKAGFIHQIKFPFHFLSNFASKEIILTPKLYLEKQTRNLYVFLHTPKITIV
jgi:hypothetical protein